MSLQILKQWVDNAGIQITEYTRDGVTVSHTVQQPANVDVPQGEVLPNPPTLDQRMSEVESVIFDAILEGRL